MTSTRGRAGFSPGKRVEIGLELCQNLFKWRHVAPRGLKKRRAVPAAPLVLARRGPDGREPSAISSVSAVELVALKASGSSDEP